MFGVKFAEHDLKKIETCRNISELYVEVFLIIVPLLILIYLTAAGLTHGGSSTVHMYTQTIHRTTQLSTLVGKLSGI